MNQIPRLALVALALLAALPARPADKVPPFRLALVGLAHDHAQGFLADLGSRKDIELAGIAEANPVLVARYRERYGLPAGLFYPDLASLLSATKVSAVAVCSSTYDHAAIIEACAARGVHVMVEKPLATTYAQARQIAETARRTGIHVVVNYETTWYPSMQALPALAGELGEWRKIVVHDGHQGPQEIGASAEFLAWLTDPTLNGGGALMDFGCYGADLITWLMQGQRPVSVTAVTQQIKPAVYPRVDDEATIILTYPRTQGIIQASWNWPVGRKDLEAYGTTGFVLAPSRNQWRVTAGRAPARDQVPPPLAGARANSLTFFAAVVRGEVQPDGLSSLASNLVVMEILDAARESARTGRTITLPAVP